MSPSRTQWNLLASLWRELEDLGANSRHLESLHELLHGPALVVGSGLGILVEDLLRRGIHPVVALDWSIDMAVRAKCLRQVLTLVGDGRSMPLADQSFRSVICATGVLDPTDDADLRLHRDELLRVCKRGGIIAAGFFQAAPEVASAGQEIGIMQGANQVNHRAWTLWKHRDDDRQLDQAVARWANCTVAAARDIIQRHRGVINAWCQVFERLAVRLRADGDEDPSATLETAFAWTLPGLAGGHIPAALRCADLQLVRDYYDPVCSTRWLAYQVTLHCSRENESRR